MRKFIIWVYTAILMTIQIVLIFTGFAMIVIAPAICSNLTQGFILVGVVLILFAICDWLNRFKIKEIHRF